MSSLPPGVQTIAKIRAQADPITRVHEAKRLLEFLLVETVPDLRGPEGREPFLSDYVKARASCFSDVRDVMWAIGVRNRLDHPKRGDEPLRPEEIERAGQHLIRAIEAFLPHAPKGVAVAAGRKGGAPPKEKGGASGKRAAARGSAKGAGGGASAGRFACPSCERTFSSRAAQEQHTHDAHGRKRRPTRKAGARPRRRVRRKGVLATLFGWILGK